MRLHQRRAGLGPRRMSPPSCGKQARALRLNGVVDNAEYLDLPVLHAGDQRVQRVLERTGGNDDDQAFRHVTPNRSGAGVEIVARPRLFANIPAREASLPLIAPMATTLSMAQRPYRL